MKRLLVLLLLTATVATAEETKLPRNTVMRTGNELVTLKAGTMVKVIEQGDKTVTVKVGDKVGTISWSALDDAEPMKPTPRRASATPVTSTVTPAASAPATPASPSAPAPHRPAQSMYGKMVEKARENEAAHDKNLVKPTDEVLDGK